MNEIAIVSYGGIFPEAKNPTEFFNNLLEGRQSITDISSYKMGEQYYVDFDCYYNSDKSVAHKNYSPMAAPINRKWSRDIAEKNNLKHAELTSTEIFAYEAIRQTLQPIRAKGVDLSLCEIILGCNSTDLEYLCNYSMKLIADCSTQKTDQSDLTAYFDKIAKKNVAFNRFSVATNLLHLIKKEFSLKGFSTLVDSACASSLAAIHCAQQRLRNNEAEFILTGGVDINVSPFLHIMFSQAGVLSDEKMVPFDKNAKGMNPGEAAATFLMCRLETALKYNLQVFGIIENCNGSSDGLLGGMTEPTLEGQTLAYQRTHKGLDRIKPTYIECHGTGTLIGDKTEIASLNQTYLGGIPIGSVKSNVGHTIGAAGAVALVKSLEIIKNRKIPPSKYFSEFPEHIKTDFFLNKNIIDISANEEIQIAISSFGFGGTNFHLLVSEFEEEKEFKKIKLNKSENKKNSICLCAEETIEYSEIQNYLAKSKHRIPPKAVHAYDESVLAGFLCLEKLMNTNSIHLSDSAKFDVHCISAGSMPTKLAYDLQRGLASELIINNNVTGIDLNKILNFQASSPKISADSASGILTNLIAGRASKVNNFKGLNFHIDADLNSESAGYIISKSFLLQESAAVVLICTTETFDKTTHEFIKTGAKAILLADKNFALENDLPIKYILNKTEYKDTGFHAT